MPKKYTTVEECLGDMTGERKEIIEKLRAIILSLDEKIEEHIKWNALSYLYKDEDRITFNFHYPDKVLLLIHMGATVKEDKKAVSIMEDNSGLINWNSNIRGTLTFESLEDVVRQGKDITTILKSWLAIDPTESKQRET